MPRLIDADALRLMKVEECAGHSIEYAMGWKACIEYINAAPTIDAIPVEWLKAQIRPYTGDVSDIGKTATNGTIKRIIRKWQKEQEVRI